MFNDDKFWEEIIKMLEELREAFGDEIKRKKIEEDIDLVLDSENRRIYITMPLYHIRKIKEISVEDGKLIIRAENDEKIYSELGADVEIKRVVEWKFNNGILDIVLEY